MNTNSQKYLAITALLSTLGLAGNYFSISLFYGVHFIFGSIAVLMAVKLLGGSGAVIVALISGSYTYLLWGHPYALVTFIAEAIAVSLLLQNKRITSLAVADLIFWFAIGMPMIWMFYKLTMGMSTTQFNLILLKQPINGIVNAIFATYLLYITPRILWISTRHDCCRIGLREIIFTILLSFSLLSTLTLIVYQNNVFRSYLETSLKNELELQSAVILHEIRNPLDLSNLRPQIDSILNPGHMANLDRSVIITTGNNEVLASTLPDDVTSSIIHNHQKASMIKHGLFVFIPDANNQPQILNWGQSLYYIKHHFVPDDNSYIYLLQHSNSLTDELQQNIYTVLSALFIVIMITSITAYFICNILSNSIIKLTQVTQDLPKKLRQHAFIKWPVSKISEIDQLAGQTKLMAKVISDNLNDINTHAEAIIESSTDAIITTSNKGIILGFNLAAERQFSYDRTNVIGKNVKLLIPEKFHDFIDAYLDNPADKIFSQNLASRYELTGKRNNGTTFPMELSVTEIKLQSETIFTAIITDITERRASEKLKREFISTVSHELRTPLTSIKGSIKLIQAKDKQLSQEKIAKLLNIAERNIERLSELINDLLDFEKLDSGKLDYNLETINPSALISKILEETTPFAAEANIELIHNAATDCTIHVDAQRFSQIIRNLISNAIKFSAAGTSVLIDCTLSADKIKITIADHGPGISSDFADKIFGRFSQADSSNTRQIQRGTGLGLAISKRLTEDMGGLIGYDSIEGEGSTFYLIFPLVAAN